MEGKAPLPERTFIPARKGKLRPVPKGKKREEKLEIVRLTRDVIPK
jgi:hypothetical protein